ncbi:unnamed protein product [Eruca vesicaria subsp. sativa]|uniref:Uncharacterized protein n=1 Tax=Eruca vesicaria subsp. sativa TaxID=29727 RepID=A0ABC8LDT2_ERUVS|nr:unnamed protein product [Eruca vesicaria subsp. sativa]
MLLLVGTPPRMTRRVSRRGEELLKAQRSSLSLSSASPTPSSLPPIEPLLETFSLPNSSPPDPPVKAPSPPEPPGPPLKDPSLIFPPEPPDPPDPPDVTVSLIASPRFFYTSRPSPQAFFQISSLKPPYRISTKSVGGGGAPVSVNDSFFAYELLSPVIYMYLFECAGWPLFSSYFDLSISPPRMVRHVHLSPFLSIYSATVEWFRQLFLWMPLDLRFMTLAGDILMVLVSFGSTFVTSSSAFIALVRSAAVCSSLTSSILGVGIMFVYLSSWWQVEEKSIFIFSPMSMEVAGYDFPFVTRLNQSSFLIFYPIWSELDEQVSLVLQGSSSHQMLFSAYGAVCGPTGYTRCNL